MPLWEKPVLIRKIITAKLKMPPAREYRIDMPLPNRKPISRILPILIRRTGPGSSIKSADSTTRLARPSLIPGTPKESGISDST